MNTQRLTLADLQASAAAQGGVCLSREYVNSRTKLHFRCKQDHEFWAKPNSVRLGKWCWQCGRDGLRKYTLADCQRLAHKRDGRCLSSSCRGTRHKLHWQCAEGHQWRAVLSSVLHGSWCGRCGRKAYGDQIRRYSLTDCLQVARQHGGKCLSTVYRRLKSRLRWCCADGHEWVASAYKVIYGQWCRQCVAASQRLTLADLQATAEEHKGRCLATRYRNNNDKVRWECKHGHQWRATVNNVRHGQWCPACTRRRSKPERYLFRWVREQFPSAQHNVHVLPNRRFELDIYVPELRKAVEFDGTYWHCLPGARERDRRKRAECQQAGVQLLRIAQGDFNADRRKVVKQVQQFLAA